MRILHDLLNGEMNLRKIVVWVFLILAAVPLLRSLWRRQMQLLPWRTIRKRTREHGLVNKKPPQ